MTREIESIRNIIEIYYNELWNEWRYELIPRLISAEIEFRGSLGVSVHGHEGFCDYMKTVQSAFPDFSNSIEDAILEADRAAVRLTYRGTHSGPLFHAAPTGQRVEYAGIALFRFGSGLITSGWVLADSLSLWRQLGVTSPAILR